MNLNELLSPFELLSSENFRVDSDVNANSVVTIPNGIIFAVEWGYSAPPVAAATLTITDGGTTRRQIPITQDGPQQIIFRPALKARLAANDLVVTLSAGGAGITSYLNVSAIELPRPASFVQEAADQALNAALTVTLPGLPIAGNMLVAVIAALSDSTTSVYGAVEVVEVKTADSEQMFSRATFVGGTVNTGGGRGGGGLLRTVRAEIWYLPLGAVSAGDDDIIISVVAPDGSNYRIAANVSEYRGLEAQAPIASNSNTGASSDSPETNPVAPSSANAVIVGGAAITAQQGNITDGPENDFTALASDGSADSPALCVAAAYLLPTVIGSYETGWTLSGTLGWVGVIAAFKSTV